MTGHEILEKVHDVDGSKYAGADASDHGDDDLGPTRSKILWSNDLAVQDVSEHGVHCLLLSNLSREGVRHLPARQ